MTDLSPFLAGRVFDAETTKAIGEAFDRIIRALPETGQPALVREVVADRVIEISDRGERDPDKIARRALKELGVLDGLV